MIGRLNHVAIAVPDLAAAAARYRDVLGARVSAPVDLPEHGVTTVFVELPNAKVELLHPLGDGSPLADAPSSPRIRSRTLRGASRRRTRRSGATHSPRRSLNRAGTTDIPRTG